MRPWSITLTESAFFKIAFAFSVIMLIAIATISFKQLQAVNNAQDNIIQSRERQIELEKIFSIVKDAERMQRGYIISNEVHYLVGYKKSCSKVSKSLKRLQNFKNKTTLKQANIDSLKISIDRRLKYMDEVLALHKNAPNTSTKVKDALHNGAVEMSEIDMMINRMIRKESKALQKYEANHRAKNKFLPYTTVFLVVFALIIFFISFYKINKDGARHRKMNDDLLIINKSFQYAEEISLMGHWKRNLLTGNIEASDNMYRLLGLEPGSVTYSEDVLMRLVHPDDKITLATALEKVRLEQVPPVLTYRIINDKGETKHFKSAGKRIFINDIPMMLGATCDVTKQVDINRALEQKNAELKAAVEELASFNHIASHDLQEPLRKIQMFISRIAVEEADVLSDIGIEYFQKVSASALRMEELIDDLLLYSETNKDDQVFELTNLNEVLQEATTTLSAEIEEKGAIITSDDLPTLAAIPFQMRQLLINLLGNALKYSKKDMPPQIKISSTIVKAKELNFKNTDAKSYYKITIADNGIGFKQEFAEKIFVLFQRLHKKESYSGTGIGLAICKKIMDNHKGYISAEGHPDKGSSFFIFLPK